MTLRNLRVFLVAAAVPLLASGCIFPKAGPAPGPLTPVALQAAQARDPSLTPESLEQGRQLFLDHCDKCHGYADVSLIADDKWRSVVPRMGQKAGLKAEQSAQLLNFVLAARTR